MVPERDYVHVMYLAERHMTALKFLESHNSQHKFNLGLGEPVSIMDLLSFLEAACKYNFQKRVARRRLGDLPCCYAKVKKKQKTN
jgi:UDP-glucose 4-epimerase